jgi:hypothetical protein
MNKTMSELGFTLHTEVVNPKSLINNNEYLRLKKAIMNYRVPVESHRINMKTKKSPIKINKHSHSKPFSVTTSNMYKSSPQIKSFRIKLKKPKSFDTNTLILSNDIIVNTEYQTTRDVLRTHFSAIKIGDRIELVKDNLYETKGNLLNSNSIKKTSLNTMTDSKNSYLNTFINKRKIKLSNLLPFEEVHRYHEDRKKEMETAIIKRVNHRESMKRNLFLEELESIDNNLTNPPPSKKKSELMDTKISNFTKKSTLFPYINTKTII